MNRVKVITDSTADLSPELLSKFGIEVVPLYVLIGEKSYLDGIEMTTEELYKQIQVNQILPKTSAPSFGDFHEVFTRWTAAGFDVLYIGLSSQLSATFQAARLAADEFEKDRVWIIDSQNLSTGVGILVLKAAEMAQKGMNAPEIHQIISSLLPQVRVSFVIDTLKFLHMGGRCNAVQLLASNVLKIRPQIIVKNGSMTVGSKFRGKRSHCLEQFYEEVVGDGSQINEDRVFVTHSGCTQEELKDYMEKLSHMGIKEVYATQAGTVISSHCGPGTIGIIYIEEEAKTA